MRIERVDRAGISAFKVDFDIPPQPHGRHLKHIRAIVEASDAPPEVKRDADAVFTGISTVEAEIHGTTIDNVHLHEVGAVDAILDVVGSIWGLKLLGVERVYCGTLSLGDGFVEAAHGTIPVPAPATLRLLEGLRVRPGPENSGELVTPTGAALMRVLSAGPPPDDYTPIRSGYGAGTRNFKGRANALRVVLADVAATSETATERSELVELAADVDDMTPEHLAAAADTLRSLGALDVVLLATSMKKGRPATRVEVLCAPDHLATLRDAILVHTSSIGVRERRVVRHALKREIITVRSFDHDVRVKVATLPNGTLRPKPEFADVEEVARKTGRSVLEVSADALHAAQHVLKKH